MRPVWLAVLLAASPAHAADECEFDADDNHPAGLDAACWIDVDAPEGCPVHFLVDHGAGVVAYAYRGDTPLATTSVVESTFDAVIDTTDLESCTCDPLSMQVRYDAIALTVTGGRAGDQVQVASGGPPGASAIVIGPPGPCVDPTWPTVFRARPTCDPCTMDPHPDPAPPGCSTGPSVGLVVALTLFAWPPRRRARARRSRARAS
jgi:hypothetical protein